MTPIGDSLTAIIDYDPNTTAAPTGGTFRNKSTASVHNWAISRYAQPWYYTGNWGQSGETTVAMLLRMTDPIAAATAAAGAGKRSYASVWGGTNDVPNLGGDSAAVIAARIQNMAGQFQAVSTRPIVWKLAGSELWTAANIQRLIDLNTLMEAWVAAHSTDTYKPLWVDLASKIWYSTPSVTQTDNSVCASQTPSAGVPMTIASPTITGGRKLLFTHTEGTARVLNIVGTLSGAAVSESLTLAVGTALKASRYIYDVVTSITPVATFTNPTKVGATGIVHKVDYSYDSLHPSLIGSYYGAEALYSAVTADCAPIPVTRGGTQLLLNPTFSTLTGGVLGANTTCSSGATPPINWRTVNSNVVDITAADFLFATDGSCTMTLTSAASATGASSAGSIRQDPSIALFTAADVVEVWCDVLIPAGAVGLAGVSAALSMNYAAGTKLYYADRNSASTGGVIPSTEAQTLTLRFRNIVIDAGTINTVNFFVHAYMNGAGSAVVKVSNLRVQKN